MALQLHEELEKLVRFLAERDPETVLEIGTLQGGTLYVWARALGSTRHVVSVDKPFWNRLTLRRRSEFYPTFSAATQIDVVYGNSHAESTYDEVVELVGDDVDFLFVDGDHTCEGVAQDFEMYRQLVGDDGLVAFHDIKRHAKDREEKAARLGQVDDLREEHVTVGEPEWGVSTFWTGIRDEYDTREFLTHPKQMGAGIGVVEL